MHTSPRRAPGESPDLNLSLGPLQSSQGPGCGDPSGPALGSVQHWTVLVAWHTCTWNRVRVGGPIGHLLRHLWGGGGGVLQRQSVGHEASELTQALPLGEMPTTCAALQIRQRCTCKTSSQGQDEMTHEGSGLTGG